jgi:para-aminobenzoate synthetase component 1
LVRNDLSRVAVPGSVQVTELCAIHSFATVHQLVSTVRCTCRPGTTETDLLRAAFPMGSMTGAPKFKAMELIESVESTRRGIYSGCVGYRAPSGDLDLNVVIRSIAVHQASRTISAHVGGAITASSDPEAEYAECLLKASALRATLCEDEPA